MDIFVGNHANQNQTPEKYQELLAGNKLAFYDPEAWGKFLDGCQAGLDKLEAEDPL